MKLLMFLLYILVFVNYFLYVSRFVNCYSPVIPSTDCIKVRSFEGGKDCIKVLQFAA